MNRKERLVSLPALPGLPARTSLSPPLIPEIERKEMRIGKSIKTCQQSKPGPQSGGSKISEKSQECVLDTPRTGRFSSIPPLASPQTPKMNPSDNIHFGKEKKKEAKRNMMQGIEKFSEESEVSECSEFCTEVEEDTEKDILLQAETTEAFQLMDKVQQQPSVSSRGNYSCASFNEQQVERPPTYDELEHMRSIIGNLQSKFEAKKKFASALQQTVNQCTSELKAERARNGKLQSALKDAFNQQQKEAEDFEFATQANQQMASEIRCLQDELEATKKNRMQLSREQLQEEAEAHSRLVAALEKERARYSILSREMQMQKEASATLKASFKDMEIENRRLKSQHHTFSESHEEMMSKKNDSRLEEAIKKEQAEKEFMQAKVADLKKSLKELQRTKAKLEVTITDMTAEHEEHKKVIEKLQRDLEASSSLPKEAAECDRAYCAEINALKSEISCLQNELEAAENKRQLSEKQLQEDAEARSRLVDALKRERVCYSIVSREMQMQKEASATLKASFKAMETENKRLKSKHHSFSESHEEMMSKTNDSRLEEAIKKEQAEKEFMQAKVADLKKSQKELQRTKAKHKVTITEMTAELEEHKKAIEKLRRDLEASSSYFFSLQHAVDRSVSDLRDERTRNCDLQRDYEAAVYQQQKEAEIRSGLEKAMKKENDRYSRAYNKIKLQKKENADIRAKLKTMETEYERMKSEHRLLYESHEQRAKKNETDSESRSIIDKLVKMVDELRAQQSESKTKLKDKLKQEITKNLELQRKIDKISSALVKEKTRCEKHRVELKELLTKQTETQEEKHKFALALERA